MALRVRLLARTENRVVRPRDFHDVYANPWEEFHRLTENGDLVKIARGYYVRTPDDQIGERWRPGIEAVALGIAVADYGRDETALMGPAAARVLGAIPRELAIAVVATPLQRPALATEVGTIHFAKRAVARLDLQRINTEVTTGWTTTPEQTVLDLADRPLLGALTNTTVEEAIRTLATRVDDAEVERIARAQRKVAAWHRYCWVRGLDAPPPRRRAPTHGLQGIGAPSSYSLDPSLP